MEGQTDTHADDNNTTQETVDRQATENHNQHKDATADDQVNEHTHDAHQE